MENEYFQASSSQSLNKVIIKGGPRRLFLAMNII